MSTQDLADKIGLGATYLRQQLIPPSSSDFNAQLILPAPPSNLDLKLPAPQLPGMRALSDPTCSVLQVNPANIDNVSFGVFLRNSEQDWLHSSPQNKRSLANVKESWFFFRAANGGHVPTVLVRSKKGTKTVQIKTWVDYVLYNSNKVDDLPTGSPPNTNDATKTAINNFNFFWDNVQLDQIIHAKFYNIRYSFEDEELGIMCLASMPHDQRALSLAHYANKGTRLKKPDPIKGGVKQTYINGIQRFLKLFEKMYGLSFFYDTEHWSWQHSQVYEDVRKTLYATTLNLESKIPAEQLKGGNLTETLPEKHFVTLNAFTYNLAQQAKATGDFPLYLNRMQHWYMQLILVFCCTRSADELAFIEDREITPIPPNKLRYKPLHVIKNATLDSHYNLVTKQDMDIVSKECFDFHHVLLSKRHPGEWEKKDRLFLKPVPEVHPSAEVYFERKNHGEHFTDQCIKMYASMLQKKDPNFPKGRITNYSIRKCHTYILNHANLPASVQQRSLGHKAGSGNEYWRTVYNDKHDSLIRDKVATAIAEKALPQTMPPSTPTSPITRSMTRSQSGSKRQLCSPTTKAAEYKSGTCVLTHDDGDVQIPLPKGARIKISIPGGLDMSFTIAK